MRLFFTCFAGFWISLAGAAAAQSERPVVIELFTSQGCSSCPPADALLAKLAQREDVIALALHVDYWDYIGWKDKFASPAFTARQKGYASANGRSRIYTPQMIVNGEHDVVGNRAMDVAEIIEKHRGSVTPVTLSARRMGDMVVIEVSTLRPVGASDIHVVQYEPEKSVDIGRGENAGRTIDYANVVSNWAVLGQWDGSSETELSADVDGPDQVAVLVQSGTTGPIMAAARP